MQRKLTGIIALAIGLACCIALPASVLAATAAAPANSQATSGVIDSGLARRLDTMRLGDKAGVIVALRDKADLAAVRGRPREVLASLKAAAARGQANFLPFLESLRNRGEVASYRPFWIFDGVAVKCTKAGVLAIAARPEVESVREDLRIQLPPAPMKQQDSNLKSSPGQADAVKPQGPPTINSVEWNIARVRAPEVWAAGITGSGVVVANIDTGVDYTHPDLADRWRGYPSNPVGNWFDGVSGLPMPYDDNGHGTHTMGTICGDAASGSSIGVAPGAIWIAAKAFDSGGGGYISTITPCMEWVMDPNGDSDPSDAPRVVNNSWGSDNPYDTTFLPQVEAWLAAGIFPSFSIGNNGPGAGTAGTPGNFEISFGTGATSPYETEDICYFSSRGPAPAGPPWNSAIKPDVSAPGACVLSSLPGSAYGPGTGTSMAAPHVTGAVALLLEADSSLTIPDLKDALKSTAVDLGAPGPDNDYGWGRIDCYEAVSGHLYPNRIAGHVEAWEGTPLGGATVTVTDGVMVFNRVTNGNGDFSLTVPDGAWTVTPSCSGYTFAPPSTVATVPPDDLDLLFVGTATPGSLSGTISQRTVVPTLVESPHPYPDYYDNTWIIDGGGSAIQAHFQYLDVESGWDYIYIYDQYDTLITSYTGYSSDIWTPWVAGPLLKVRLVSDFIITAQGFVIDGYATDSGDPVSGVTVTLSPGGRTASSNSSGFYQLTGLPPMVYQVTPTRDRWTFTPAQRTETVVAGGATTGVDFMGLELPPVAVLVYDDATLLGSAREALDRLGYPYTRAYSSDFNTVLASFPWDLVLVDCPNYKPGGGWGPLIDYIGAGGRVALSTWYLISEPDLCAAFGVSSVEDLFAVPPIYRWDTTHDLFNSPQSVPDLLTWSEGYYIRDADRLLVTDPEALAVAGFTPSETSEQAALVIGNSGRTIMNAFLWDDHAQDADADGIEDCVELIMNEIQLLAPIGRTLDVGEVGGAPGAVVTVPVSLDETDRLAGLQFDLNYAATGGAPPLDLVAVRAVGPAAGWASDFTELTPGAEARILAYHPSSEELPAGEAIILELDFQVDAAASSGEVYTLHPLNIVLTDGLGGLIEPVTGQDGSISLLADHFTFGTIETPQGGDLSCPLPFLVHIEARDGSDALDTGYDGTADLTASCCTAAPSSVTFVDGVWEGWVTLLCDLDPECHLTATDQSFSGLTGDSNAFNARGKCDATGDGAVNVFDVLRTVNLVLSRVVPQPPRLEFQSWAGDANCDEAVNVQDVILIVNKSLGPAGALAMGKGGATRSTQPVVVSLVPAGHKAWAVSVSNAAGLAGVQLEVSGATAASAGALAAQAGWSVDSNPIGRVLRVVAYSPSAAGLTSGDGALIRLTDVRGKPRLTQVLLSDGNGQRVPVQLPRAGR